MIHTKPYAKLEYVSTLAGQPGNYGDQNGIGTNALFNFINGITLDEINNVILIADSNNYKIKSLDLSSKLRFFFIFEKIKIFFSDFAMQKYKRKKK